MQTFILQANHNAISKIKELISQELKRANENVFFKELTQEQQEALEDIELARIGDEAYKEFLAGDRKTYTLDEIIKKHDLK